MKRPHRRAHLLIWLVLAPVVLAGVALALKARPPEPVADIPPSLAEEAP
ncbi:MAG: hypothetical protein WD076_00015 [Parvularculaceae bacterium]